MLIPVPFSADVSKISAAWREDHIGHNIFKFLHNFSHAYLVWTSKVQIVAPPHVPICARG
jgi:hypothetical protein